MIVGYWIKGDGKVKVVWSQISGYSVEFWGQTVLTLERLSALYSFAVGLDPLHLLALLKFKLSHLWPVEASSRRFLSLLTWPSSSLTVPWLSGRMRSSGLGTDTYLLYHIWNLPFLRKLRSLREERNFTSGFRDDCDCWATLCRPSQWMKPGKIYVYRYVQTYIHIFCILGTFSKETAHYSKFTL